MSYSRIAETLAQLGLHGARTPSQREMMVACPFHDDRRPSLYINLISGLWICHAGCGQGNLQQLEDRLGGLRTPIVYPEAERAPILRSWLARGLTAGICEKWGIVWDPDYNAMRLPLFNDMGEVVGNIWRAPAGIEPKYRYQKGMSKGSWLYGFWRLRPQLEEVYLVEGPLDAIWGQEAELPAVSILGASVSDQQVQLLVERGIRRVVLAFDNDAGGKAATARAAGLFRRAGFWVYRLSLPSRYKDLQEVPLERVRRLRRSLCVNGSGVVQGRLQRWKEETRK